MIRGKSAGARFNSSGVNPVNPDARLPVSLLVVGETVSVVLVAVDVVAVDIVAQAPETAPETVVFDVKGNWAFNFSISFWYFRRSC